MMEIAKKVSNIPLTSTGHVRKELKIMTRFDYQYKNKVRKSINTNPHIYNLLSQVRFKVDIHTLTTYIQMKF